MPPGGTGGRSVKSTGTAFDVIEALEESNGSRVTELAERLDLAKSTVHNHLATLRDRGYVVREGDVYQLGLSFFCLGQSVRTRREGYTLAKQKVEKLAAETRERVQFIVGEHGRGVYVHRETGPDAVRTDSAVGGEVDLHATAAGKAILAELSRQRVDAIVDERGLRRHTQATITDPDDLREELDRIAERGYALNREEHTDGLRAVGVAVTDPAEQVLGAISVSGPTHRLRDDRFREELPDLLLGTVNELELNIAYA